MHQIENGRGPAEMLAMDGPIRMGAVGDKCQAFGRRKSPLPGSGSQLPAKRFRVGTAGNHVP